MVVCYQAIWTEILGSRLANSLKTESIYSRGVFLSPVKHIIIIVGVGTESTPTENSYTHPKNIRVDVERQKY